MTAGYTRVTYNGVRISHCATKKFHQEPVFDASETDLLYYKFIVRVVGIVHGHLDWGLVNGIGVYGDQTFATADASAYQAGVRFRLLENRQPFEMRMGISSTSTGTVLLAANPVPASATTERISGYDLNNGPKCRVLDITHVSGNEVFKIEAEFEICKLECDADGNAKSNTSGVLSNRWSVLDDIDQNLYTTRTYEGTLRTFSNRINPNYFRHYVVPPLQPGLRRERIAFTVSEDGLNLRYTIVDKEVAFSAPDPATNWSYRYSETAGTVNNGMANISELSVMLEGDRNCDKKKLLAIAAGFIEAKTIRLAGANRQEQENNRNTANVIEFLQFSEESGSGTVNRIYANARVKHPPLDVPNGPQLGNLLAASKLGRPIDKDELNNVVANYDANRSRGGGAEESPYLEGPIAFAGAFVSYLQRPCSTVHKIKEGRQVALALAGETEQQVEITGRVVSSIADQPASYLSESHVRAIYMFWKMDSTYRIKSGKVALPVAASSSRPGASSDSSSADSVRVVSLHKPIANRITRLSGERVGEFPELPSVQDSYTDGEGVRATLLESVIKPSTSTRTPDGKELHRVDAEYVYALGRAPKAGEKLAIGRNPWDRLGVQSVMIVSPEFPSDLPQDGPPSGQA